MKLIATIATFAALVITQSARADDPTPMYAEDPSQQQAHCRDDNTKRGVLDTDLYNYCLNVEHQGYLNLAAEYAKYQSRQWAPAVLKAAIEAWTKRGVRQDSMVAYEFHNQTDAFEDIQYAWNHDGETGQEKINKCGNRFITFDKVNFCYKNFDTPLIQSLLRQ
jgi:hypothetical protein